MPPPWPIEPFRKPVIVGTEQDLRIWLHTQRYEARRGQLDRQKAEALDAAVPGWRTGDNAVEGRNDLSWVLEKVQLDAVIPAGKDT